MPARGRLQHSHDFTLSKASRLEMKKKESVKSDALKASDFGVWCEHCCIRIAPNEERVALKNRIYHQRCYAKAKASAGAEK
jgi:hypothetical protein